MTKKKKNFPKIKRKLKWFLTDESGKISKKDALGLAVGAVLLSSFEDAIAAHTSSGGVHSNVATPHSNWPSWHLNQAAISCYNSWWHSNVIKTWHSSNIVNGHSSWTPNWWHSNNSISWTAVSQAHASWYGHGNVAASHSNSVSAHSSHAQSWSGSWGGWC